MKPIRLTVLLFLVPAICSPAHAEDAPPTDESLRELIALTRLEEQLRSSVRQVHEMVNSGTRQLLQGRPPTPEAETIINAMKTKSTALIDREFSWENMEPLYLNVYRDLFTQEEIDGMLAFYKSPAGQAMVRKMPQVTRITTAAIQKRMGQVMQQLQKIQNDTRIELNTLAWRGAGEP